MSTPRRYNPFAPAAPVATTPEPPRPTTRRRSAAKAAAPAPAPAAPPAPPRPVAALRLSDLLPGPKAIPDAGSRMPDETAVRQQVTRETARAFMEGGRSAVLPTAAEQEARVQERLAAASSAPAPVRLFPTWRRHAPVPA